MKSNVDVNFWRELKANRPYMTKQHTRHQIVGRADAISAGHRQYRTIKGQAAKGQVMDARKGMKKVMMRRNMK